MIPIAVTAFPYGQSLKNLGLAQFDFTSQTFRVMLTTSSYVPSVDTHEFVSDVGGTEITGSGYSAGGVQLAGLTWSYDASNDWCLLTCTAPVWANASFTARRAVVYRVGTSSSDSPLLSYVDFGANVSPSASNFSLTFANGVYRIKAVTA